MRTSVVKKEHLTFDFTMTDGDVISAVDECNVMRSEEASLTRKKQLIQQDIKKLITKTDERLNHIVNRLEPREVECDVVFNYETKMIDITFEGEVMESRRMSDWEYASRPEDIYPEVKKHVVDTPKEESGKTSMEVAMDRAEEIAEKEEANQVPSANVKAFSEAKTEKSVCTPANLAEC